MNLKQLIQAAVDRNILPRDAASEDITRPWPIVLMTGVGAWLAAVPLIALIVTLCGDALSRGPLAYVLGGIFLAGGLVVLRDQSKSEFIEQLALPVMLVGGAMLGMGFYRDLPPVLAGVILTLLVGGVAWLVVQSWLRVLLGALCGATFIAVAANISMFNGTQLWIGLHLALAVWVAATVQADSCNVSGANAGNLLALESASTGWITTVVFGLAVASGKTFIAGAQLEHFNGVRLTSEPLLQAVSLAMAIAGAAWMARNWATTRAPRLLCAAALLAALAWLIPTLGGALLVLAVCVASGRWRLAIAAAIAAGWIIGGFYYQLTLPLGTKALIMAGIGAAFGLIGWLSWPRQPREAATGSGGSRCQLVAIGITLAATLIVANGAIWQKEHLISTGKPVYIELAPVDPRSLMQGDYMALNFSLPELISPQRRAKVVAKIDAHGIAVMQRVDEGKPLAPDEILIELLQTGRGLRPATDAWYFKEGEGERWAKAKYGEFRIDSNGRALLVGLRGANLDKL